MPDRPAVAAAPIVGEDRLGHLARLGGVALLEARPGEQAAGPAQAALVADLLEGGRRLAQQHLGLLGPARSRTRTRPGSAGPRPRRAGRRGPRSRPAPARGARWRRRTRGGTRRAEASQAQHLGLAGRVAELGEHATGLVEGLLRRRPARLLLLDVGQHEQRPAEVAATRRRRPAGSPRRPRAASARAGAISRSPARARARPVRNARWRGPCCTGEQAEPLAVEALGHHGDLGLVGAAGRLLEPVQGALGEVGGQARRRGRAR